MHDFPIDAFRELLDYVYADEERNFESYEGVPAIQDKHIFNAIKKLSVWEHANRKYPPVMDEGLKAMKEEESENL